MATIKKITLKKTSFCKLLDLIDKYKFDFNTHCGECGIIDFCKCKYVVIVFDDDYLTQSCFNTKHELNNKLDSLECGGYKHVWYEYKNGKHFNKLDNNYIIKISYSFS
jgi:hypothetical protein